MEIWLGSPAASYSIRAHNSPHTLEGVALGDFNYGTRRFPQSLVIANY